MSDNPVIVFVQLLLRFAEVIAYVAIALGVHRIASEIRRGK